MIALRWVLGVPILLFGACTILFNWIWLISNVIWKGNISTIPLVGGICGAIGLLAIPDDRFSRWWWVPVVADYRCFATLIVWMVLWMQRSKRQSA